MSVWTIGWYELKRLLRRPSLIFLLIVSPLVLIFILGSALSNFFQPKDVKIETVRVGIYQMDEGDITKRFEGFLEHEKIKPFLQPTFFSSRDQIVSGVKEGKVDLGLVIPADFSKSVLEEKEAKWELILGRDRIKNSTGRMLLQGFLDETNRMQAAFMTLGPQATVQLAATMNSEPKEFVQIGTLRDPSKEFSAIQYYAATMMVMFLLYSGMRAAVSLLAEKENHTLQRMQSLPLPIRNVLFGKLLGNGLLAGLQATLIILITHFVYGVDWGISLFMLALVCIVTIIASMGLGFLSAGLLKQTKMVTGVFAAFIGVMTFVSGGMSPFESGVMATVQKFTVNYWASDSLLELMLGNDISVVWYNLGLLSAISAGILVMSIFFYKRVGYHE